MDSSSRTLKAGLIGTGIQASLTPAMHMAEGAAQGLRYDYELIDLSLEGSSPDSLPDLLRRAQSEGFCGLNITHPCKQRVIPCLDTLSREASALGAVNTVVFRDGKRVGHNTDWWGFAESFRRGLPDAGLGQAVQIGAGGAGLATAYAMLSLGLGSLVVFDHEVARAAALVDSMRSLFPDARLSVGDDMAEAMRRADGLVHATPMGMANYPGLALEPDLLSPRHWVAEIVYFPLETALVRAARERGCRVLDGGGMAVFQAVGAFRHFTGREPDVDRMLRHFKSMAG